MRSDVVKFKTLDGSTVYDSVADWGMTLTHCDEQKPAPKFERIDVPGTNGSVDVSAALSGDIPFEDRTVELTFFKLCADHDAAFALAGDVAAAVHGKQMQLQTPDARTDGNTWYTGDVEITECRFEDRGCEIDVRAVCSPFRYAAAQTGELLLSSTATDLQQALILELANSEFNTMGVQFNFENTWKISWIDPVAVGVECAATDNLFDMDFATLRGVTVKSAGSWQKSNNIVQSGQAVDFGSCNQQWCERAVINATSATANIKNVRLPFTQDSHLYVFVESSAVTAKQSITVDGATHAAGVEVRCASNISGDIGADGMVDSGGFSTVGTLAAPAVGSSFGAVINCGAVPFNLGQIAISLYGVTVSDFTARVMIVKEGVSVSGYVEPDVAIAVAQLPVALEKSATGNDTYTSYPVKAFITKSSSDSSTVEAPAIADYMRNAKYAEFASITASGDVAVMPSWYADVSIWPTQSATVDAGDMPVYPSVMTYSGPQGVAVAYNGSEYLIGADTTAQLATLLNRGSNTVDYVTFTPQSWTPAGQFRWTKGVL